MRTSASLWRFATRARLHPAQPCSSDAFRGFAAAAAAYHNEPLFKGVLIDAAGTLLVPSERSANVYLRYAQQYGVTLSEDEVLRRYRR